MRLYNSMTGKKEEFIPLDGKNVKITAKPENSNYRVRIDGKLVTSDDKYKNCNDVCNSNTWRSGFMPYKALRTSLIFVADNSFSCTLISEYLLQNKKAHRYAVDLHRYMRQHVLDNFI